MAEINPLPATCQTLSEKLMAARVTAQAHDAALAEVEAAAREALPDMLAAGMQNIDAASFFKRLHDCGNNYWNLLDAHKAADKLRRERRMEKPAQTRGPGGGGR